MWNRWSIAFVCTLLVPIGIIVGSPEDSSAAADLADLYREGTPILDVRYRFEFVDQDRFDRDAKANTVRTRFGFETGKIRGFGLGVDVEWTESIGQEKFNSTTNGRTDFPIVADPDDFALNRLFLVSDGTIPETVAKLGRQRLIWDNARFIGNVGFRQNEQTFDAFRVRNRAFGETELDYAYLDKVHRIFGTDSPVGELGMKSHAIRAKFTGLGFVSVAPFVLLLDYDRSGQAANSSATYGALLVGDHKLSDDWTLLYSGSLARQSDYGDNPNDFGLWYYAIEPGVAWNGVSARLGYEVLEGNGTIGLRTPLATLHKFNGFTDRFLVTPADGLQDLNLKLAAKLPSGGWVGGTDIKANWHEFFNEENGSHYGREWNLGVFRTFRLAHGELVTGLQYADYRADEFGVDTRKFWLTIQFKLSPEPYRRAVRGRKAS
jgi:hypothetical protein